MKTVCAVIVTYNRKELLVRNIKSLLKQSYPLDILIYDNCSTDGTEEYLMKFNILNNKNIQYVKGNINSGGAGGFYNGEKIAVEQNYDYIWLMDDDGYCVNNFTLEQLVNVNLPKKTIRNSYVMCDETEKTCTFDLNGLRNYKDILNVSNNDLYFHYANPYNGTLVPRECFLECGYTDPRLFIYGDENDFMLKTECKGYVWCTVLQSLYFHPINRVEGEEHKLLGLSKFKTKDQPIWKMYYETRNNALLMKRYFGKKISYKHYVGAGIRAFTYKDKRIKRIFYSLIAIHDAKIERYDRPPLFGK